MKKIILAIFLSIIICVDVNALLISPPYTKLDYNPGQIINWSFNVGSLKDEDGIQNFEVYPYNELNRSLFITSPKNFSLVPRTWIPVYGSITIPDNLSPGTHKAGVVVVTMADKEASGIAALVGLEYLIYVDVPYPGKYLDVSLDTTNINTGDTTQFILILSSRGDAIVNNAQIKLKVLNPDNKIIYSVEDSIINIKPKDSIKKIFDWTTNSIPYGSYKVEAEVNYDTGYEKREKNFKIGDLYIKIINITGTNIIKKETGKVIVTAESQYNSFIDNTYASIEFITKDERKLQLKSSSLGFDPFTKNNFEIFLPTDDLEVGTYDAKAYIYYSNKTEVQDFKLKIKHDLLGALLSTQTILITIIILLLMLVSYMYIKSKNKKLKNETK